MATVDLSNYVDAYVATKYEKQSSSTAKQKERVVTHFTQYLDANELKINTDEPYDALDAVRYFFSDGPLSLSQPYLSHIRDYLLFVSKRLDSTRNQDKLRDIKEKITKDRWPDTAFETDEQAPEFIPDDDIEAACRTTDDRGELVIRFLFQTGCRIGEMRGVTADDLDFTVDDVGAAVRITKKRTDENEIEPPKSEAGNRTVELNESVATMLQDYIDEHELSDENFVFPMSESTYRQTDVKQAFTDAGVLLNPETDETVVTPHWLRHQRNTRIKNQYGSEAAQQYMGHENQEMTDHYTHNDSEQVLGVVGDTTDDT